MFCRLDCKANVGYKLNVVMGKFVKFNNVTSEISVMGTTIYALPKKGHSLGKNDFKLINVDLPLFSISEYFRISDYPK